MQSLTFTDLRGTLLLFFFFAEIIALSQTVLKSIHVLLADDQPLVRLGLTSFIKSLNPNFTVYVARDGKEALALFYKHPIDLLILDYRMPGLNGYDVANEILSVNATKKIIMVSMYTDEPLISSLFQLGVSGFVSKHADVSELEKAIAAVLSGRLYWPKEFEDILGEQPAVTTSIRFTDRELDLVASLSKGKTSIEIARNWGISLKTVETYRSRLIEKTGVKNVAELIHYFHKNGQF